MSWSCSVCGGGHSDNHSSCNVSESIDEISTHLTDIKDLLKELISVIKNK